MNLTATNVGVAVFAAMFLALVSVYLIAQDRLSRQRRRLRERLSNVIEGADATTDLGYTILRDTTYSRIPLLDRTLSRVQLARRIQRTLEQSGLPIKAGPLILGMLSLAGFVWLLLSSIGVFEIVALAAAVTVGMVPYLWVLAVRRKRFDRFEELLPEAIDLIVNALRSGFSLPAALSLAAQEMPEPLSGEFAIAFEEQNLGIDLVQALENMNQRIPSLDLKIMVTAISIQKRAGGNLTEVLSRLSEMMRERFYLRNEIKIFTAQGRMSGIVLAVLPIVLAVLLTIIYPEYFKILFEDRSGRTLLLIAFLMQVLGFIWIRRIVNIKL